MKNLRLTFLIILLIAFTANAQTITKGLIGEQDIKHFDGTGTNTFSRLTSSGGTLTLNKVGTEVDALMVYGGGVNYTNATITSALSAIGTSTKATLLIRPGTWTISTNVDWSAYTNVTFKFANGAVLSHGSYTVKIPNVDANQTQQIFSGTGAVTGFNTYYPGWFGAKGDGTVSGGTDDSAAVDWMISSINANAKYVTVKFDKRPYNLRTGLSNAITVSGVRIVGEDTVIYAASGKVFQFNKGSSIYDCSVNGFYFYYDSPTVDSDAVPVYASKVIYFKAENIRTYHAPAVLYLNYMSNFTVRNIKGSTANVAKNAIHINHGVVGDISDVSLISDACLPTISNPTACTVGTGSAVPVANSVFIRITSSNDTLRFNNILCNRYDYGIYNTTTTSESSVNVWIDNAVTDYCLSRGIYFENTGGSINNVNINKAYTEALSGIGIDFYLTGGATKKININSPHIYFSGTHGIRFYSSSVDAMGFCTVRDPDIAGSNRTATTGYDIYAYKARVSVFGGTVGLLDTAIGGTQGTYGVYFDACTQFIIDGVSAGGSTGSFNIVNTPASTYYDRFLGHNKTVPSHSVLQYPEYTYTTFADSATPSVGLSDKCITGGTTTITNILGGTVGQRITIHAAHSVTITDGTNIFLNGSANWSMNATDTLMLEMKTDGKWYEISRSDNT